MAPTRSQPARGTKADVKYYTLSNPGETSFHRTPPRCQLGAQPDTDSDNKVEPPQPSEELFECDRCGETKLMIASLRVHQTKFGCHTRKGSLCISCRVKQRLHKAFSNANLEDIAGSRKQIQKACFDFIERWSDDLVEAGQVLIEYELAELQDNLRNYIDGFLDGRMRQARIRQSSARQRREVVDDSFTSYEDLANNNELDEDKRTDTVASSQSRAGPCLNCRKSSSANTATEVKSKATRTQMPDQQEAGEEAALDILSSFMKPATATFNCTGCHRSRSHIFASPQQVVKSGGPSSSISPGITCIQCALEAVVLRSRSGDDLDGPELYKYVLDLASGLVDDWLSIPRNAGEHLPIGYEEDLRSRVRHFAELKRARIEEQRSRSKADKSTPKASPDIADQATESSNNLFSMGFGHCGIVSETSGECSAPATGQDTRELFASAEGRGGEAESGSTMQMSLAMVQAWADERGAIEHLSKAQAASEPTQEQAATASELKGPKTCGHCHRIRPQSFFVGGWISVDEETCLLCHIVGALDDQSAAHGNGLAPATLEAILRDYSYSLITNWYCKVGEGELEAHLVVINNQVESYFARSKGKEAGQLVPRPKRVAWEDIMVIDDSDVDRYTSTGRQQTKKRRILPKDRQDGKQL